MKRVSDKYSPERYQRKKSMYRRIAKKWRDNNKDKTNAYQRKRYLKVKDDPSYKAYMKEARKKYYDKKMLDPVYREKKKKYYREVYAKNTKDNPVKYRKTNIKADSLKEYQREYQKQYRLKKKLKTK